jgi:hypothetical protein
MGGSCLQSSYSGGRDQENYSSKPTLGNSLQDSILKISNIKKGWHSYSSGRAPAYQVWGPEFKPQFHQKEKKKTKKRSKSILALSAGEAFLCTGKWLGQQMSLFLDECSEC